MHPSFSSEENENNYSFTELRKSSDYGAVKALLAHVHGPPRPPRSGFCIKRGASVGRARLLSAFSQNLGKRISIREPHKKRRERSREGKGTMGRGEEEG